MVDYQAELERLKSTHKLLIHEAYKTLYQFEEY